MYGGRAPKGELCNKVCMYVRMYCDDRRRSLTENGRLVLDPTLCTGPFKF